MFPRYFVPRRAEPDPAPPARGPLLLHVVDVLRIGGPGRSAREVAVVVDRSGALHLIDPADLPPGLVPELHHHELSTGGATRLLDCRSFSLFTIQILEQPGDAPGINDPVHLYGRMYAPLPAEGPPVVMADGQLSLTRADVLDGFVRAARDAFTVGTTPPSRCLHALLPGDRAEAIEQGQGVVLAYALPAPELMTGDPGNEALVADLVYDVLVATQVDAKRNAIAHPLLRTVIPVPSREDLERDLDNQGWDIKGNQAIRRSEMTRKGLGSVFTQVFGVPDAMKLDLPPEGTVDELLALAEQILPAFQGFPDRRIAALRTRIGRGTRPAAPAAPAAPSIPRPSAPDPSARQGKEYKPERVDWMRDFDARPAKSSAPARPKAPARVSRVDKSRAAPADRPDWMKDFDDT